MFMFIPCIGPPPREPPIPMLFPPLLKWAELPGPMKEAAVLLGLGLTLLPGRSLSRNKAIFFLLRASLSAVGLSSVILVLRSVGSPAGLTLNTLAFLTTFFATDS